MSEQKNSNEIIEITHKAQNAAKKELQGFQEFIDKQNVVGIAVGLAVGTAASTLATSLVNNIIMDPIAYFLGSAEGLRGLKINMGIRDGQLSTLNYGNVLADLVNFIVIALVFYYIVRLFRLDKKLAAKK